jgi:uncharacterized membrane protein
MDAKKLMLAIVVGYLVLMATGYLIHEIWLLPEYRTLGEREHTWRDEALMRQKIWIMWIGQLLFTIMFAYVYTRGVEKKPWIGQGIRYAILMTLLAVVPATLSQYVVYRVPYMLAIKWMAAGGAQLILLGLIVAGVYNKAAA